MEAISLSDTFSKPLHLTPELYREMYAQSTSDNNDERDAFWLKQAELVSWRKFPTVAETGGFDGDSVFKWFEDGKLNIAENCIDRHLETRGDQVALIFEPNDPNEEAEKVTYRQLYERVNACANVLKKQGVQKGDVVTIYLPMIPEAAIAMLACARIGAVHSVVFSGFAPSALRDRINQCNSKVVITADAMVRGKKMTPLKSWVDEALVECPCVDKVLVVKNTQNEVYMEKDRDVFLEDELKTVSTECPAETMNAEDPLFVLFTSGSTGAPKGVVHTTGGYIVGAAMTDKYSFDRREGDVHLCTADVGWITGHTYVVYGPLANGTTTVLFDGTPDHPTPARLWQLVEKFGITTFYTAPTAIRGLMEKGEKYFENIKLDSLRILGSVGEPINPEAWMWYFKNVGKNVCRIVDTWWQTETGMHMIAPIPGATEELVPGSAMLPYFGVKYVLLRKKGDENADTEDKDAEWEVMEGPGEGKLFIEGSVPAMARTLYGDHEKFKEKYILNGKYFDTGDIARRDEKGLLTVIGRDDDIIKVAGHRLGAPDIEKAAMAHPFVAEAATVGCHDDVKGNNIYIFVKLKDKETILAAQRAAQEVAGSESVNPKMMECEWDPAKIKQEITELVRLQVSPIATPKFIQFVDGLPKTRSGKIMRRLLRKLLEGVRGADLGNISTLTDSTVLDRTAEGLLYNPLKTEKETPERHDPEPLGPVETAPKQ